MCIGLNAENDNTKNASLRSKLDEARASMTEMQEIIEGSFDGILVTDGEGNVLLVNQSYVRHTNIQKEELLGHNVRELINPVWMKNSVALLAIEQQKPVTMHHTTRNNKNIMATGTPIFGADKKIKKVVVNTRDISEIYNLREELIKAKEMEKIYFDQINNDKQNAMLGWNKDIVITNPKMREVYSLAKKVSNFNAPVLISGESGVGKEMLAKFIHMESALRNDKPFIAVNCGAIPENLLESELFGYTEGSFTGAIKGGKQGLFEAANGGTLILDEIGEMSPNLQVKLLRVLETRTVSKVGSTEPIPVDIFLIALTNRNLEEMVERGTFREDLYYRLNVISILIPPLHERRDEILPLSLRFINYFNKQYGQNKTLTYEVIQELLDYPWPGNTRQLKNVIENMVVVSNNEYLQLNDLPWLAGKILEKESEDISNISLQKLLESYEKSILGRMKAKKMSTREIAQELKIDQSTVVRKLQRYGISHK
jgi:PAS domain S-box-containing protein/TyrR family helix-turn-helix protein